MPFYRLTCIAFIGKEKMELEFLDCGTGVSGGVFIIMNTPPKRCELGKKKILEVL